MLLGGDLSLLPIIEAAGVKFKDNGVPADALLIFSHHGVNCIRLRLFVKPNGKQGMVNDLPYTIALAQRVKKAGLKFYLDLHYSDGWADPGHQMIPSAWRDLSYEDLKATVEKYTTDVVSALREAGAPPDYVAVGNEITSGMMWPMAHLSHGVSQSKTFDRLCGLLDAGIRGVHAGAGNTEPAKTILHIDRGARPPITKWFFDNVTARQVPFDIIGLSYYPFQSPGISELQVNMNQAAKTYGKPVMISEVAFPYVGENWNKAHLAWPATPQGQRQCLIDVIHAVQAVPDHRGMGVFWWYPEGVPVKTPAAAKWFDGECSLFDREGNALPALDAFKLER